MKTIMISLGLFVASVSFGFAQTFEGIATYKTDRKVDLAADEGMDDATMKSIQAQLKKQFQREYTLQFDGSESLYEQVQNLEKPSPKAAAGGVQIMISGDDNTLYRNIDTKTFRN
ncbi:MAG: GLPGLI family protein, partial [Marinirhabdus sp.]|nr:GLPGLI family protein [Marinirhabdus sp.]